MKWVLDTNIIFSGTISTDSPPHKVLKISLSQEKTTPILTNEILDEYKRVLKEKGKKYGVTKADRTYLLTLIKTKGEIIEPEKNYQVIEKDPEDDKFLEAAVEGKADFLVSGDSHLLEIEEFKGIEILSPNEAIETIKY